MLICSQNSQLDVNWRHSVRRITWQYARSVLYLAVYFRCQCYPLSKCLLTGSGPLKLLGINIRCFLICFTSTYCLSFVLITLKILKSWGPYSSDNSRLSWGRGRAILLHFIYSRLRAIPAWVVLAVPSKIFQT